MCSINHTKKFSLAKLILWNLSMIDHYLSLLGKNKNIFNTKYKICCKLNALGHHKFVHIYGLKPMCLFEMSVVFTA